MSRHLVSCVIPAHNAEKHIGEAIDSVLAQTYPHIEIIVVDDGSTDRTFETADAHAPSVTCHRQAQAGPVAARNRGVRGARGHFIAFLDADDIWEPEKTERQLKRFEANPDLQACFTWIQNFWTPELTAAQRPDRPELLRPLPGYTTQTMLVRLEALEAVGHFSEEFKHASEQQWVLRAAEEQLAMEMLPEVLVRRRLHSSNYSTQSAAESHSEYLHLLKATLDRRRSGVGVEATHDFSSFSRPKDNPATERA